MDATATKKKLFAMLDELRSMQEGIESTVARDDRWEVKRELNDAIISVHNITRLIGAHLATQAPEVTEIRRR